jgi:hypothetical protein
MQLHCRYNVIVKKVVLSVFEFCRDWWKKMQCTILKSYYHCIQNHLLQLLSLYRVWYEAQLNLKEVAEEGGMSRRWKTTVCVYVCICVYI